MLAWDNRSFQLKNEMPETDLRDFAASRMSVIYTSFGNIWTTIRGLIHHPFPTIIGITDKFWESTFEIMGQWGELLQQTN